MLRLVLPQSAAIFLVRFCEEHVYLYFSIHDAFDLALYAQVMWPMMDKCVLETFIFVLVAFRYDTEVTPPANKSNKQTELL